MRVSKANGGGVRNLRRGRQGGSTRTPSSVGVGGSPTARSTEGPFGWRYHAGAGDLVDIFAKRDAHGRNLHSGYSDTALGFVSRRTLESHGAFFIPYLHQGMRVLDCGCGPGSITFGIAARIGSGSVVGVDMDESQVRLATANAAARGATMSVFGPVAPMACRLRTPASTRSSRTHCWNISVSR